MFKSRILTRTILITKRTISNQETEVIFETLNNAGIVTLNRPNALNTLNTSMFETLLSQLGEWESRKRLVIIKGAGEKAFCAGGDVKVAVDKIKGLKFFQAEYTAFNFIGKYKIPNVAFMDGITMGGGLALSAHGRYRIATERTIIAMPETKIGLVPDIGGFYFGLGRKLKVNLGLYLYLSLTGESLKGQDVVKAGVATHFVSSKNLSELENHLSKCTSDLEVESILNKFDEPLEESSLPLNISDINYCFSASSIEEIIKRLETVQNDWSVKTLETLHKMCPGSLKIAMRALQRGVQLERPQCIQMEYRISVHSIGKHDFPEGVRALLIDKDKKPRWNPRTLAEVNDDYIESFFKKLPDDKELKFDANF